VTIKEKWIWDPDLERLVDVLASNRELPEQRTPMQGVVRDIEPYRPVAAEKDTGIRPDYIGGRRQHREFLQRNGYREVGNEPLRNETQLGPRRGEVAASLKRTLEQLGK